jgi:hypothetical protein
MYWIDIQEHFNDLVIGTYGRGIWILDDLSPLQQLNEQVTKKSIHLFDIKSSYRFQNVTSTLQMFPEASTGQDPPSGASLNYWLDDAKDVEIVITNSENDTVKTISDKGKKGINRVWWNFMGEKSDPMVMRTKPLYADWFSIGDDRVRNVPSSISIMQPPGKYNVSVVSGEVSSTKQLEVIKDPHSEGTLGDIKMQNELVGKIYNDLNITTEYVNTIESVRRQLLDLKSVLSGGNMSDDLIEEVDGLENKFLDLEKKLLQLKITGKGQDGVRYEKMIGEKLSYLAQNVQISDFRPADSYYEVYELLHKRLEEVGVQLETLVSNDLNEFVKKMNTKGINTIVLK